MAIQIPTLKRMSSPDAPSVGRVDVKAPDLNRAVAPQAKAAEQLVETGVDYFNKEEEYAIDTLVKEKSYQRYAELENNLDQAQRQQGDPTLVYNELDVKNQEGKQKLLESLTDVPERYREQVSAKLDEVDGKFHARRTVAQGKQAYDYDTKLTGNLVKVAQSGMIDASTRVDPKNPDTLIPIGNLIGEIMDLRFTSAEKYGLAKKKEDGTWDRNPSLDLAIKEDLSKGLSQAILNLSVSGQTDAAQSVMEKYGKYIDPSDKASLMAKSQKAIEDQTVYAVFDKIKRFEGDKAINAIEESDLSPKQKEKVLQLKDGHDQRIARTRKNASATNANELLNIIEKSAGKFHNFAELEADPVAGKLIPLVTDAKQFAAIKARLENPPKSNEKDVNEAYTKLFAGEFTDLSPLDFQELMTGLNKKDRTSFESEYKKANTPSLSQEYSTVRNMGKALNDELLAVGYVEHNRYGKYDDENQILINNARREMVLAMNDFPPGMSVDKQYQWVHEFALTKKSKALFKGTSSTKPKTFDGGSTPKATPTGSPAATKDFSNLSMAERVSFAREFEKEKGYSAKGKTDELKAFIQMKLKGK